MKINNAQKRQLQAFIKAVATAKEDKISVYPKKQPNKKELNARYKYNPKTKTVDVIVSKDSTTDDK